MITLYSGTPGAGKSLHLATRLYHWMQFKDAPIIGNFSTNFSSIKSVRAFIFIWIIANLLRISLLNLVNITVKLRVEE